MVRTLISDVQDEFISSIKNLGLKNYFMNSNFITNHIKDMISKKGILNPEITLQKELFNLTHKTLICTSHAFNIIETTSETKFISHTNNPTFKCTDVLQMSFSIPIFFDFIEVDNTLYVDGSVRM